MLEKYIDCAHVEPLHLKNNAWQHLFKGILKEAIRKSKLPGNCKKNADVPVDSIFNKLLTSLDMVVKAKRVCKKVKRWFDDTQGHGSDMQYRFTGKDSRKFCHNYMSLVKALCDANDTRKDRQTILVFAYIGTRLRDIVSLINRFEINKKQLAELRLAASEYLRANAMFLPSSVNPTIWTLGHIAPVHAEHVFAQYNKVLSLVTMEGREAKHISLKTLSQNTTYQRRWFEILKHEYIMLIWLPENGYELSRKKSPNEAYIPTRVLENACYCYCGALKTKPRDAKCSFCGDPLMRLIEKSVREGKIDSELKK